MRMRGFVSFLLKSLENDKSIKVSFLPLHLLNTKLEES